jgi:cephalosporin-C deacetylase-like acetyl esterase
MKQLLTAFLLLISPVLLAQEEDLSLLKHYQYYADDANALYKEMVEEAEVRFDARESKVASLATANDWKEYQQEVKLKLAQIIGPFPEKTPLNPEITGVIKKDDYTVEKLIYESQPGFYVTAALFLPNNRKGKAPAIVYCSGHSDLGFRSDTYQTKIINLVKKGFVVLAFDPLGQGERMQYPDDEGKWSRIGGSTHEHSYAGAQSFINGNSLAKIMIWDGIRSVDYLLTRPEVDPQRIGMTGRSGGGTQTAYIAAFDDRIVAAAPEAYITRMETLLKTRGPQDAEQNLPGFVAKELDLADYLVARVPKPTLIISTSRDFFSIEGARDTYHELQRAYRAMGKPENISMSEDDAPHASTSKNREAMYAFFQQHLQNPGDSQDEEVEVFKPEELWATSTGEIMTDRECKNVFDLERELAQQQKSALVQDRQSFDPEEVRSNAKGLSGFEGPAEAKEIHFAGQYQRDGYRVQKYLMIGERHVSPFLLFLPNEPRADEAVVYFHPDGKSAEAGSGGEIESLVRQGLTVLAADVAGTGELGPAYLRGDSQIDGVSFNTWSGGILLDKSILARQAEDMVSMVHYLKNSSEKDISVTALAHATLAPALLHAAAFEPAIERTVLVEPLFSYADLLNHEFYDARWIPAAVNGAMKSYDLADLAASLPSQNLLLINPQNHAFENAGQRTVKDEWQIVGETFGEDGNFEIRFAGEDDKLDGKGIRWME